MRCVTYGPELVNGHLQSRFVRLEAIASRVVQAGCGCHLDVTAHDPADVTTLGDLDKGIEAFDKFVDVADVEASWIDRVAGE